MALPQDGQNANGLTKVTEVPTGKELIFVDPTTNEGGIITLEDLTTQILNKLTSKIFTLDQGNITLIEALNKLNSKAKRYIFNPDNGVNDIKVPNSKTVYVNYSTLNNSNIADVGFAIIVSRQTNENTGFVQKIKSISNVEISLDKDALKFQSDIWVVAYLFIP